MNKQTDLEFIENLLIRIGFMNVTKFPDLKYKDNTFFEEEVSLEEIKFIRLSITYKEGDFNNDLFASFDIKGKRITEL